MINRVLRQPAARWPWRELVGWLVVALLVRAATLAVVTQPGYMDASYYYHVADNLVAGRGLVTDAVWNFLDPRTDLPRPSNAYWPPGTSLVAAVGGWLFGPGFRSAQIPMVVLSAAIVPLAYLYGRMLLGTRRGGHGVAALMLCSAAYYPYWVTTDTFTPYGLLGVGCFLLLGWALWVEPASRARLIAAVGGAGVLAGWSQLVRPDGLVLATVVVGTAAAVGWWRRDYPLAPSLKGGRTSSPTEVGAHHAVPLQRFWRAGRGQWRAAALWGGLAAAGYLLGALPWYVRNWLTWGSPLPMAGGQTMFLRRFDDIFAYGIEVSPAALVADGWSLVLTGRLAGLIGNLVPLFQVALFVLVPLAALGVRRLWREPAARPALLYVGILYLGMSLVFPTTSPRGSFFHGLTPAVPVLYAALIRGLDTAVGWAGTWRRWNLAEARAIFLAAAVVFQIGVAGYLAWQFVLVRGWEAPIAQAAAGWLDEHAPPGEPALFIDPPAFAVIARRPAVMVPSNSVEALIAVAQRFRAPWLILGPRGMRISGRLYLDRVHDEHFEWMADIGPARVYRVRSVPSAATPARN